MARRHRDLHADGTRPLESVGPDAFLLPRKIVDAVHRAVRLACGCAQTRPYIEAPDEIIDRATVMLAGGGDSTRNLRRRGRTRRDRQRPRARRFGSRSWQRARARHAVSGSAAGCRSMTRLRRDLHQHLPELAGTGPSRVLGARRRRHTDVRLAPGRSRAAEARGDARDEDPHTRARSRRRRTRRAVLGAARRATGALGAEGSRFALGDAWHQEADERSRLIAALVEGHAPRRTARAEQVPDRSRVLPYRVCSPDAMETQVIAPEGDPPEPLDDQDESRRGEAAGEHAQGDREGHLFIVHGRVPASPADSRPRTRRGIGEGQPRVARVESSSPAVLGGIRDDASADLRRAGRGRLKARLDTMAGLARHGVRAGARADSGPRGHCGRAGMPKPGRRKTLAFQLTYAVYMVALVICRLRSLLRLLQGKDHSGSRGPGILGIVAIAPRRGVA